VKWQEHEPNTSVLRIYNIIGIDCTALMLCVKYYGGCSLDEDLLTFECVCLDLCSIDVC